MSVFTGALRTYFRTILLTAFALVFLFSAAPAFAAITSIAITAPIAGNEWRGTQNITWSAAGAGPGDTVDIVYSNDGFVNTLVVGQVSAVAGTFSWNTSALPDAATYQVKIFDHATPAVNTTSGVFMVDNTAPVTSIALAPVVPNGLDGWYITAPTVTLSCADALSGCLSGGTKYRFDSGVWNTYAAPFVAPEGSHTLEWYSEDEAVNALGAHNVEATNSLVIKVDTIFPTVAVTSTTADGFYNESDVINATLTFSEEVSSMDALTVTFDTGGTCTVAALTSATTGTCNYTVLAGHNSSDLTVSSIVPVTGVVEDVAGNDSTLIPTSNIADTSSIVVDTTAPAPFSTGSVSTVGGTVVALWWNSTNIGADVVVPVANDVSLTNGTIQLQLEADGTFGDVGSAYTILVGDLGGNKTLSLTAAEIEGVTGFSETDVLTFRAVITDNATNATTGADSADTFTVDQIAPSVDAGSDKEVNATVAQDATTSDGGSGLATHQWAKDTGVGTVVFGSATAVDTTISVSEVSPTGDDTYAISLTVTDVAGNTASDTIAFAWDTTAPVLVEVTPVPTPTNDTTPDYTFSADSIKQLVASVGGSIAYGGTCSSATTNAAAGNNTITFNSLGDAVHNTCTIAVTDAAGNTSLTLNISSFEVDTIVATVSSITTTDTDEDGRVDTATVVFDDEVKDSTFVAGAFTIGGTTVTSVGTGGTADDATIVLTVAGGVAGTEAKLVTYTPGSATDLAGNALGSISQTSTDAAGPILLSAITTSVTTLDATYSEDLDGTTVNGSGSEFTVAGAVVSAATESAAGIVTLTYSALGTGAEPLVTFTNTGTFTDLVSVEAPTPQSVTAVDGVAPLLTSAHIESDNADTTLAMEGDEITLTFTSSETITTPTVLIQGVAATVDAPVGDDWTAHRVMTTSDTQGPVTFSIAFSDDAAPTPNTGATVTAVTDASDVFYDSVDPLVDAGSDQEVNAVVSQNATVSDPAPSSLIATYVWTNETPGVGTITFGTPSTEDTTISADTDGTYTLRLTVTDNAGNVTFDEITFIWDTVRPEGLTSVPSNNSIDVEVVAGTATVLFDEDIVLLDSSRVLLVNDASESSHKGAVAVQGGDGNSATLNIDYTGLAYGTKYRIQVKPGAVSDVATNALLSNFSAWFTTEIDTIAPVVNSFSAGSITTTGATLSVTTDEAASCRFSMIDEAFASMTPFTTTGATSHSHALTGLTPSTGYDFYVRCEDTTAQLNTMTTSAHVSFTTLTPDTTAPVITNIQSVSITQTGATITWDTDEMATSRVEYGPTSAYGSLSASDVTADNTAHSVALTGLTAGTTYHFRVLSTDAASNAGVSVDGTFATLAPDPDTSAPPTPAISTVSTTVNSDSYTIMGTAGADTPTDGVRTISVYNGASLAGTASVALGQTTWAVVVTLSQNATSTFTAISRDAAGNESAASAGVDIGESDVIGADLTPPDVPVITTADATVDADTYEIAGTVTADTDIQTVFVDCGCSVIGSVNVPAGETDWALTVTLIQNTINTFTARSADASGNLSDFSNLVTIEEEDTVVVDTEAPISTNVQASSITTSAATITWDTDEAATSQIEYGLTSSYGSYTTLDTALLSSHSQSLSGLAAGTTYHFRVVSADTLGNSASSTDNTFTTAEDADVSAPATPVITTGATTIDADTITITGTAGADLPTDGERTITISRNGTVVGTLTLATGVTNWSFIAPLLQATTSSFTAKSTDASGNASADSAAVVITEAEGAVALAVTGIEAVRTFATADNTFENGWAWTFHVTVPTLETSLKMKFTDLISGIHSIAAASNIRFYSAQSSDASTAGTAKTIAAAGVYSDSMTLATDADASAAGRQVDITVEVRVPTGSAGGSYSASYGIETL